MLGLATHADDKCLQVLIWTGRLAMDRVGRNDDEIAAPRHHGLGPARPEVHRERPTADIDIRLIGGVVMPATHVAGPVPDPGGPTAFAFPLITPFGLRRGLSRHSLLGLMDGDRS